MATDYRNTEILPSTSSFGTPGALVYELFYGSTLRRLQAQFLNAYSTLPFPPLPRFAAEIGVYHRAHPRSAAALPDLIRIHFKAILSEI